jgi:large subunit ribosomal protein L28
MAKCAICDKGVHFGHKVSHSNKKSNKMWKPNIKNVKAIVNGAPKKIKVCTQCLKSGNVVRA